MGAGPALVLPPDLEQRFDRLGLEFLAEFLGRHAARHPRDFEPLSELATVLTQLGRLEEGLAADRRLVELAPRDPTVHYNLACSLALLGETGSALDTLEHAEQLGYRDAEHLASDQDLARLHGEERFRALLERLRAAAR